jgi:hypothetical protein
MSSASNTALMAWMARNPNSILGRSMAKRLIPANAAPLSGSNTPGGGTTPPANGFSGGLDNSSLLGRGIGILQNISGSNGVVPTNNGNTPTVGTPTTQDDPFVPKPSNTDRQTPMPTQSPSEPVGLTPATGTSERNDVFPNATSIPSFAEGGLMTEQGTAVRPGQPMPTPMPQGAPAQNMPLGAATPKPMENTEIEANLNHLSRNPEAMDKIRSAMVQAVNSGEVTPEELNMIVQLAKVAMGNPKSWAQIRQFAIQNGLATDAELPREYDQGLVYTLLAVGKALQQKPGNTPPVQGAVPGDVTAQQPPSATQQPQAGNIPQYKNGGPTGDKAHLAVVHKNEYVIPEDALLFHGKKTFDNLIAKAREGNEGQK